MENRLLDAIALLLAVVVEQTEGIAPQKRNGYKVASCKECHKEIDEIPHEFKTGYGTEDDH